MLLNQIFILIFIFILIALFYIDLKYLIYPDWMISLLFIISIGYIISNGIQADSWLPVINAIGGSLVILTPLAAVWFISKRHLIGLGDIKLAPIVGLFLGLKTSIISLVILSLLSLTLFLVYKKSNLKVFQNKTFPSAYFWAVSIFSAMIINHYF